MVHNPRVICSLLLFIACLGNIASITKAARVQEQQQQPSRTSRRAQQQASGFPGSAELMQRGPDEGSDLNRQVRSNHFSAEILNQNHVAGDNRNNMNYYRRSRVNAEFATAAAPAAHAEAEAEAELVPISVATTAPKTVQQMAVDGDDNHNHDEGDSSAAVADGQVVDKRKLLLSNLHLFNGTDTKNLTDSQKMLLIQIADRVARYGENNLFRELANAQQQQKEGPAQDEGRANTKTDSQTTVTKKARPSKRPHAAVHPTLSSAAATPSKAGTTTTTKRQPLPTGDSTVSAAPTKSTTKTKIRPNTSFTPLPAVTAASSAAVTPSVASTQSLSTPAEAEKKATTAATSRHTKKPPGSVEDIIYDYNVTASALIESLSKPSPTSNSLLYQQTLHPAAAATGNNKQSVNLDGKTQPPTKPNAAAAVKPTKYHYYPHNQHIYLLPECATQQVCNAVYVRLNYTQPLCACPSRYRDPCSASLNEDDLHTTKLIGDKNRRAVTLAKTCESISEMKQCREPSEWSLLAVQNTRTGKSHYLVICRCPDKFKLEGPMSHDQPTYANLPGIRVFGMKCVAPAGGAASAQPQRKKPTIQQHRIPPKQGQSSYQYLHRPDNVVHASELPQHIQHHGQGSLGALTNGYGRSADEGEEQVSETTVETETTTFMFEEAAEAAARQKKSMQLDASEGNYVEPEFPWHKVMELQDALRWNVDN